MKNTNTCPKCGTHDIVVVPISQLKTVSNIIPIGLTMAGCVGLTRYVCGTCGFTEEWNNTMIKIPQKPASDTFSLLAKRSGLRLHNISLLGLLAIVACVALGISHAITSLRLSRANHELATLRKRLELIPVNDPDLIAARQLPSTDKDVHRWAVRLPSTTSKVLYLNWGASPLSDVQNIKGKSVHMFQLTPDPATREAAIEFTVQCNPNDPKWGSLKIVTGDVSIISISSEITSLLMGDIPCSSEAIGDVPVTRAASSPITLFATESSGMPKSALCIWIDDPPPSDGR